MLFAEDNARLLLVLHGVVGAALVAASTHLAVWTWPLVRGAAVRARGVRILAATALGLYLATFALGNVLYPVYKVRVRVEYLDSSEAVRADALARAARRGDASATATPAPREKQQRLPRLGSVSHVFDIKEHWATLGVVLAFAAFLLARAVCAPRAQAGPATATAAATATTSRLPGQALFAFAVVLAACSWLGALIGLWVTSFRSVGKL